MAYGGGLGAFAKGLAGGLQTGMALGGQIEDAKEERAVRKAMKAASTAKAPVGSTEDLGEYAVKNYGGADFLEGAKTPEQIQEALKGQAKLSADYRSVAQTPLAIPTEMVAIPEAKLTAKGAAIPSLAVPTPMPTPAPAAVAAVPVTATPSPAPQPPGGLGADMQQFYADRAAGKEGTYAPSQAQVEASQPQQTPYVYKDPAGRTRVAEQTRDLSDSERYRMVSRNLMEQGLWDKADKFRKLGYENLKMDIEEGRLEMESAVDKASRLFQTGNQDAAAQVLLEGVNNSKDGIDYKLQPVDGGLALMGVHTETGLPASKEPLAVFGADPTGANRTPQQQMLDFMRGLISTDQYDKVFERNIKLADTLTEMAYKKAQTGKVTEEAKFVAPLAQSEIAYRDRQGRAALTSASASMVRAQREPAGAGAVTQTTMLKMLAAHQGAFQRALVGQNTAREAYLAEPNEITKAAYLSSQYNARLAADALREFRGLPKLSAGQLGAYTMPPGSNQRTQPPSQGKSNAPPGVDAAVWNAMTPEEQALF